MSFDCIVTQVHIPDYDVQGGLHFSNKVRLVEFGLTHLRQFNPNSCIILSGHGHRPQNLDKCDVVFWDDVCYPLNEYGYVVDMPAQFKSVYKGLAEAQRRGYKYCLKTRGDCIIGIPNITTYSMEILEQESRRLLITQQTGDERLGDCFMFGEVDLLCKTWHQDNCVYNADGLQNTAYHYRRALNAMEVEWYSLIKSTCAFRDVDHLKFTCLRWNWGSLFNRLAELLSQDFNFGLFHWGRANGWHNFSVDRVMSGTADWMLSERKFYQ